MEFVNKPHQGEYPQCTENKFRQSQKPVPAALDRPVLTVLFETLRIDNVWGFDLERSFTLQNVLRIP